jgi:DNA integrity scanning protein DisA with diadenylate cyclase activity
MVDEISRKVAREFETVGEFVAADAADLKAIDDVGPERAETLATVDAE